MGPSHSSKGGAMDYQLFTSIEVKNGWSETTHIETGFTVRFNINKITVNGGEVPASLIKMAFEEKTFVYFLDDISDFCNRVFYGY